MVQSEAILNKLYYIFLQLKNTKYIINKLG